MLSLVGAFRAVSRREFSRLPAAAAATSAAPARAMSSLPRSDDLAPLEEDDDLGSMSELGEHFAELGEEREAMAAAASDGIVDVPGAWPHFLHAWSSR